MEFLLAEEAKAVVETLGECVKLLLNVLHVSRNPPLKNLFALRCSSFIALIHSGNKKPIVRVIELTLGDLLCLFLELCLPCVAILKSDV